MFSELWMSWVGSSQKYILFKLWSSKQKSGNFMIYIAQCYLRKKCKYSYSLICLTLKVKQIVSTIY